MNWENLDNPYSAYEEVPETKLALPAPGFRPRGYFYQAKLQEPALHWKRKAAVRIEQLQRSDWQGAQLRIRFSQLDRPLSPLLLRFLDQRLGAVGFKALHILRGYLPPSQAVAAFLRRVQGQDLQQLPRLLSLGGEHLLGVYQAQRGASRAVQEGALLAALKAYGPLRYSPYCCDGKERQVCLIDASNWSFEERQQLEQALKEVEVLRFLPEQQAYRLQCRLADCAAALT